MSYVDESIYETKRQSVTLTEDNYDAYPETILFDINLDLSIDLKIEKLDRTSSTGLIWGHPTRGKWGTYKWHSASSNTWTTEEELINV